MTGALLFDFNGVLVDDESQHYDALRTVLAGEGIGLSRADYWANYLGFDDRMCFQEAFRRAGRSLPPAQLASLIAEKSRTYERLISVALPLVSGAAAFVTQAAARFPLAIVSGALRGEIEHALSLAGLRDHFAVIVAAEDVTACKPDPQGYEAARDAILERGTGAATRCVVIEDSLPGLEAARRAGMPCAMLTTSHPRTALGDADLVWDSFAGHDPRELEHLLQS